METSRHEIARWFDYTKIMKFIISSKESWTKFMFNHATNSFIRIKALKVVFLTYYLAEKIYYD